MRSAGNVVVSARIDPRVLERARSEPVVPVFIVLDHQPQREILERAESASAMYRQVAESRYRQASGAEEVRQAREAAEAVVLRTRQQAFQAIEQAIGPEQDALESRLRVLGAVRISRYLGINMLTAEIPASAIAALEADPAIAHVFPVEKQYAQLATSVPALGAPAFWNAGYTGQGESVGILDSGVRTNHPAFAGVSIVSQVFLTNGATASCFGDDSSSGEDHQGHGTYVAGVVASQGSAGWTNYQGVAKGIATLYNLKVAYQVKGYPVCDVVGPELDQRDVVAALDWAVRNTPLKIFNYSFDSPSTGDDDGFTQSIDQYIDAYGLTMTIAAGNDGKSGYAVSDSPGIAYNSITVGNWVSRGSMNPTSAAGPTASFRDKPDLAAPGTDIFSAAYNWDATPGTSDDFADTTGTSLAAAHIAGSVALIESAGVSDPLAVKAVLINTTNPAGSWTSGPGWGYTDLNGALEQLNLTTTSSLAAGAVEYYKMLLSGDFRATVAWNRHVSGGTSYFNDIELHLYSEGDGTPLDSAASSYYQNNVEKVFTPYSGQAVLAVVMHSAPLVGVSSEPYAIAFNVPWSRASGPSLSLSCSLPPTIQSGAQFTITCTLANSGDLTAFGTGVLAYLPDGFSPNYGFPDRLYFDFGNLLAHSSSTQSSINVAAPNTPGTYAIRLSAYDQLGLVKATGAVTATVVPALSPPVLLSPSNGATGVSQTPTLTWTASSGATSYDVYLGTTTPLGPVGTVTGTSYTPSLLFPAALYYWQVVAKNAAGSSSSATWAFTTQLSVPGQQQYVIQTVAGNGTPGYSGDGGPATSAQLYWPSGVAVDEGGNIYIADSTNGAIRRVAPSGTIITLASQITSPAAVAVDDSGEIYFADADNYVRKMTLGGPVTVVAGSYAAGCGSDLGDGGPATSAHLCLPKSIAIDAAHNVYIADSYNGRIRKVDQNGIITTVAGNGSNYSNAGDGGPATSATLWIPTGVALDAAGNLYIADSLNHRIRKVDLNGIITTVAGSDITWDSGDGGPATSAGLIDPVGVALDGAGNLYIADSSYVRVVLPNGIITRIAGGGVLGPGDGGPATSAQLDGVHSLAPGSAGRIYLADMFHEAIRVLLPTNPCQYLLDRTVAAVSGPGGVVSISIQTGPSCSWGVNGLPDWITSQASGQGPATVNLVVAANSGTLRTATITVAGAAVTITQGDSACAYFLGSGSATSPAAGGAGLVVVTAGPSCPWTAFSPVDWVTLAEPASGVGNGTASYSVAPDTGGSRSGTLTIAGLPFSVQQLSPPVGLRFVPVAPCRVADTRFAGPSMAANSTRSFAVPQSGCGIPSTAQAYSLNVTVVPQGPLSYLTLWPTGQDQPFVSTLNSWGGIVVANAAIVPAGTDGAVSVYVTNPTDVILDINGYFDSPGSYAFYAAQPCRVADTRGAAGPFGAPSLSGGQSRDFPVPSSSCGLPSTASAYSMNVTVVPDGYLGYLTTWPTGQAQPNVSTLNSWTGKVVANAAIVPAGTSGSISVYAEDPTEVILDTNGYFGAPGGAGALNFYPVTPCRVADTRSADGPLGGPEMEAATTRSFPIPASACGIPAAAAAYSVNVTVVPDGVLSYLTAWPAGSVQPFVSTLNSWDGAVVANAAIVPAGASGAISVYVTDRTHVILDINGYFAP